MCCHSTKKECDKEAKESKCPKSKSGWTSWALPTKWRSIDVPKQCLGRSKNIHMNARNQCFLYFHLCPCVWYHKTKPRPPRYIGELLRTWLIVRTNNSQSAAVSGDWLHPQTGQRVDVMRGELQRQTEQRGFTKTKMSSLIVSHPFND